MSMKNSNDTIGNQSHDLPVCSALPQPLRHHVPPLTVVLTLNPQITQFQWHGILILVLWFRSCSHLRLSQILICWVDLCAIKVIQLILPTYLEFNFVTVAKVPDIALDPTNFVFLSIFMILSTFLVCSSSVGELSWWTEPSALSWLVPFGEPFTELVDNCPVL
jgi:hypothetical protein